MTYGKRLFILSMLACLSCSSDNDTPQPTGEAGPVIRFGGQIAEIVQSKAIIDSDVLPDGSQVGIFGWGHRRGEADNTNTTGRNDLNNNLHTKESGTEILKANVDAHYPINPDTLLNLYAYCPYQAAASLDPLKIPFDLSKQEDLMWANPIENRDKTAQEEKIDLQFNHLLSAITLIFKKADDIKEDNILQEVSLENYPSTIYLNVQSGQLTAPASTSPYSILTVADKPITTKPDSIVINYLLLPTEKPVFIIKLSKAEFRIPSSKAFQSGKKQTYEFTIQAKDIHLSGSIAPWQDGGTSNEIIYF